MTTVKEAHDAEERQKPYPDIPDCKEDEEGGYCLTEEERALLRGDYYGMTFETHPQLEFLRPFTEDNHPPNESVIYYTSTDEEGNPGEGARKYIARFYGRFDGEPFTESTLHKFRGVERERSGHPAEEVAAHLRRNREITEGNRARIEAVESRKEPIKERARKVKRRIRYREKRLRGVEQGESASDEKVIEWQEDLRKYELELERLQRRLREIQEEADEIDFLGGIETLDRPRREGDGTDTFRDAIAVHDAPHSVALFLNELEGEACRPPDERDRQFAIHNITGLAFPYGLEYVKFYTQGGEPSKIRPDFPLVVTSSLRTAERDLQENGLPKAMARWCTRIYKTDASENFYREEDLEGIAQLLGMTRFQSAGRREKQPATTLSILALDTENTWREGGPDREPALPEHDPDEEGNATFYDVKYYSKKRGKWKVKKFTPSGMRIYQTQPIFDWTEGDQLDKMAEYGIPVSPIIQDLDFHGCLLCPMRNAAYYRDLYDNHRLLWSIADDLRQAGSRRNVERGDAEYYYLYNPKKDGPIEEAAEKHPEKFIRDEDGDLRPLM
jgi:3'-phosphoadenosine 5'-phosphosulfate sulfotransferase (PAPS reductase)/FAD synthetase